MIAKAVKNAKSKKTNEDVFTPEAPKEDDKASNQQIMSLAEKAEQKQAGNRTRDYVKRIRRSSKERG